ncbi:CLIP1, partial [Symbiodinium necroappetens]
MEFQRVAGEDGLDQQSFVEALTRACGESVSSLQAEKLWLGYLQQSELSGSMVLATFWAICEAVSQGDVQAAEFADMTVEEYVSYGAAEARADFRLQHDFKLLIWADSFVRVQQKLLRPRIPGWRN